MYQTLLAKYGPQGVAGFNWNESQSLFLQGKAAMWLDGIGFAQPLEDPTKSRIVGKVGYGVMPPGPKAQVSALFGDGEGISPFSKKKGPSWLYLQWASNKTNQTRMLQAAAGAPVRNSAYAAAQASSDFKAPKEWVECMLTSASIAQPGLPIIVAGHRVPRHLRHRAHQHDQRRRSRDRAQEGDRRVPAGARQEREGLTRHVAAVEATRSQAARSRRRHRRRPRACARRLAARASSRAAGAPTTCSSLPALVVVGAVIVFPWLFTLWMSVFDWKIGSVAHFVGLDNYAQLADQRALPRGDRPHVLLHRCSRSSSRSSSARSPR